MKTALVDALLEALTEMLRVHRLYQEQRGLVLPADLDRNLIELVGLEVGDRVTAINGVELVNAEAVLRAYNESRGRSVIFLDLVRAHKWVRLEYELVKG
ncbi:MAG: hypothetical protein SFV15_11670 [Polyangiaceae bacterium]|nr:hypothetical protein [Polyangiaceae bacterium]